MATCGLCNRRATIREIRDHYLNGVKHKGDKMPKVTWDGDVSADDVESAKDGGDLYEGPIPPSGAYTFVIKTMTRATSSKDNPMVSFMLLLDDPRKDIQKKYKGCPLFSQVVIVKQNDWRIKEFCKALGISAQDFFNRCVADEKDAILKFGTVKIKDANLHVRVLAKKELRQNSEDEYRLDVKNFLPAAVRTEADELDEKPAKAKKAKKSAAVEAEPAKPAAAGKAGKKGKKAKDDEPPF
jgi:hypothetical protein